MWSGSFGRRNGLLLSKAQTLRHTALALQRHEDVEARTKLRGKKTCCERTCQGRRENPCSAANQVQSAMKPRTALRRPFVATRSSRVLSVMREKLVRLHAAGGTHPDYPGFVPHRYPRGASPSGRQEIMVGRDACCLRGLDSDRLLWTRAVANRGEQERRERQAQFGQQHRDRHWSHGWAPSRRSSRSRTNSTITLAAALSPHKRTSVKIGLSSFFRERMNRRRFSLRLSARWRPGFPEKNP